VLTAEGYDPIEVATWVDTEHCEAVLLRHKGRAKSKHLARFALPLHDDTHLGNDSERDENVAGRGKCVALNTRMDFGAMRQPMFNCKTPGIGERWPKYVNPSDVACARRIIATRLARRGFEV
jgi:hypothetical protein